MVKKNVAIPLQGKMAFRSFHTDGFISQLAGEGLEPVYYIEQKFLADGSLDPKRYSRLVYEPYQDMYAKFGPRFLSELRRFLVRTETTELRFRDMLMNLIFTKRPITQILLYGLGVDALRRLRFCAPALLALEQKMTPANYHREDLLRRQVDCILTPGVGSYGFLYEGLLAREARTCGIPVVASVSNYDNIVNRGYMGFVPDKLAVWSKQMADEALTCLRLPADKIEVTGPVQFDRYAKQPALSREEFLRSKGLDPNKKTIFYAGGVFVAQYYEFLRIVRKYLSGPKGLSEYNIVIRPVPHNKVLSWYGMDVLRDIVAQTPGMYYSDPHQFSSDSFMPIHGKSTDVELDELHCLFKYSDVMINIFSTVALESAINDLPTIHLGYESFAFGQRYPSYPAFQGGMTHNLRPLRLAAGRTVTSDGELIKTIEAYLRDKTLDRQARHDYAVAECGEVDGKAGLRLASLINAMGKQTK